MRILFVTMQLGRSYAGGTERYVTTLGDALRERGHEVSCLAGDPLHLGRPRPFGELVEAERGLHAYPTRGWMTVMGLPPRRIEPWLAQHRPDLVHVNNPAHVGVGVMAACRRLDIPIVVTVHDYWWICPKATLMRSDDRPCDGTPGWAECIQCIAAEHHRASVRALAWVPRPLRSRDGGPTLRVTAPLALGVYLARAATRGMSLSDMARWPRRRRFLLDLLDHVEHVIFPSRAMADVVAPRLAHDRWQVIPNGLEPRWFASPREPSGGPLPPESLTVGFAGSLAPHKAPHLVLEAVRRLGWTRTRVRLAGPEGDRLYSQRLRREADGLNVEFVGAVPTERMPAFLRTLDVFAMTSTWPENFPYVVLEAQAAGVPVVGSRAGGVIEQVNDARLLFEPGSAAQLAEALEYARTHPQAGAPERLPTLAEMADATEAVYRRVAGARNE